MMDSKSMDTENSESELDSKSDQKHKKPGFIEKIKNHPIGSLLITAFIGTAGFIPNYFSNNAHLLYIPLTIFCCLLWWGGHMWIRSEMSTNAAGNISSRIEYPMEEKVANKTVADSDAPSLIAKLFLDKGDKQNAEVRITLKNTSNLPLKHLQAFIKAKTLSNLFSAPPNIADVFLPGSEKSIPIINSDTFDRSKDLFFDLKVFYEAEIYGKSHGFLFECHFIPRKKELDEEEVAPSTTIFRLAEPDEVQNLAMDAIEDAMLKSNGSFHMATKEKRPDGQFNDFTIHNGDKIFIFFPSKQTVAFTLFEPNGGKEKFGVSLPLGVGASDIELHVIIISWSTEYLIMAADGNVAIYENGKVTIKPIHPH